MDIQHLRVFTVFAQKLNYTRAANELFESRQAVSKTIRNIESELGTRLIQTTGKRIELTREGHNFAAQAQAVVEHFDALVQTFSSRDAINGAHFSETPVRLGFSSSMFTSGMSLLMRTITDYTKELPGGSVVISQWSARQCCERVSDGTIDAALVVSMPRAFRDCTTMRLGSIPFALAMPEGNSLSSKDVVSVADLRDQHLILLNDYEFIYPGLIEACSKQGFSLQPSHLLEEYSLALAAMLNGEGVLILDERQIPGRWPAGVRAVPFVESEMRWELSYIYRSDSKRLVEVRKLGKYLKSCDLGGFTSL